MRNVRFEWQLSATVRSELTTHKVSHECDIFCCKIRSCFRWVRVFFDDIALGASYTITAAKITISVPLLVKKSVHATIELISYKKGTFLLSSTACSLFYSGD